MCSSVIYNILSMLGTAYASIGHLMMLLCVHIRDRLYYSKYVDTMLSLDAVRVLACLNSVQITN